MYKAVRFIVLVLAFVGLQAGAYADAGTGIRLKELCRLASERDNALVGYGIVTGLAGTGDSPRSRGTLQSISNTLSRFGVNVSPDDMRSRNAAAVMVTANLPAFAQPGDRIDANITSIGDARSLLGGTLLLTHLTGADGKVYSLAQGPLSVGGFSFDYNGNLVQKNHPTTATLPGGAVVEKAVASNVLDEDGTISFVLYEPDFTTADRVANGINSRFSQQIAYAVDAGRISVRYPYESKRELVRFITQLESVRISPDNKAQVVINERTGTVVSGANVKLSPVSVTHGDIQVVIKTEYFVSQPDRLIDPSASVRTAIVPETKITAGEAEPVSVTLTEEASIGDLVSALNKVKTGSRDIIIILQAIKRAGALHAELVIQ